MVVRGRGWGWGGGLGVVGDTHIELSTSVTWAVYLAPINAACYLCASPGDDRLPVSDCLSVIKM